jgi:EAL and modified HD-GYP domain-containing signal transduction protein
MRELLAKRITGSEANADRAFMCGVLSLIDVLFQIPIEQALMELSLDQDIKDALIQRKGLLGSLLTILENHEMENLVEIKGSLEGYGLTLEDLFAIERTATIEYENYQE